MATGAELYRELVERGFNQGDLTIADEIGSPHHVEHEYLALTDAPGPEILRHAITMVREHLRDARLTILDIVEVADKVWVHQRCTGVHAASGRPVSFEVIDICRFEDGRLVEHWGVPDRFAMLHQLDLL